jgi:hypothetical protein
MMIIDPKWFVLQCLFAPKRGGALARLFVRGK